MFIWLNFLTETVPAVLVVYFKNLNPIFNFFFHSIPFSVFTVVLGFLGRLFLIIQHFASLVLWFLVFQFQSPPLCFSVPSLTTKCFCGLMEYWIPSWKPCFYSVHFKSFFYITFKFLGHILISWKDIWAILPKPPVGSFCSNSSPYLAL